MGLGRFARAADRIGSVRVRERAECAACLALADNTGGRFSREADGRCACASHGTVRRGCESARRALVLPSTHGPLQLAVLNVSGALFEGFFAAWERGDAVANGPGGELLAGGLAGNCRFW